MSSTAPFIARRRHAHFKPGRGPKELAPPPKIATAAPLLIEELSVAELIAVRDTLLAQSRVGSLSTDDRTRFTAVMQALKGRRQPG